MPPESSPAPLYRRIADSAAEGDRSGAFPRAAFDHLHAEGHVASPPLAAAESREMLGLLATIGRGDLSVGRIFEGHVNALLLVAAHGTDMQQGQVRRCTREGGLLGVWNTDLAADPLRLEEDRLYGAKSYASGIDGLSLALVTIAPAEGRRLLLVPVEALAVERDWWRPMGMRASGSHIARFDGLAVDPAWFLGGPGDYVAEPFFSGGAIRFAAVQAGGMHGIFDVTLDHLRRTERQGDPYQKHRLARMAIALETAYGWLDRAARAWRCAAEDPDGPHALAAVAAATRCGIEAHAVRLLDEAERAVGAAGFNAPHPLERRVRDLRTYLRQPNPDGALAALGEAVGRGTWVPGSGV